jgi:gluconate 2-dehydrogenase gamma chain
MHPAPTTRRDFLAELTRTAAAAALALQLPLLATLAGCARDDTEHFAHLTPAEARTMRALAAQIIPSEAGSPGAEEAGVVYFVDRALGEPFFADTVPVVRAGLADLDARARAAGARGGFSSLSDADQAAIVRRIANGPFFASARTLVLIGTFADRSHGGNRGGAGAKIVGMEEHRPSYAAPFGWYDAPSAAERAESAA